MSPDPPHARLLRLATLASLGVIVTLVTGRATAWWLSDSVSPLVGLTDSLLDGATSLLNLLAVHYSLRPANDDHRYDHGEAEALTGLAQAMFIGASAVLAAIQVVEQLRDPQPLGAVTWGIAVMLLSLLLTVLLLAFQTHVIRRTDSTVIRVSSLHYRSDLLLNASILVAPLLTRYGWPQSDGLFGLGIALYILWSALQIAHESMSILMDRELPTDTGERMHELVRSVPGVLGAHDVRTRTSGNHWFVQLHLKLPGELSLSVAHALVDRAVLAIKREHPKAEVLTHTDPQEVVGKETVS